MMKCRFATMLGLSVVLNFIHCALFALEIPPLLGRVNDYAHMISPPVRQQLDAKLAKLEQTDSTQIAILTVTDLQGVTIEEYSMEVAKKWKIGQQKLNNGVIFLVAKENRKMRIEVGYGLEGVLTDILAGKILDREVRPHFKAGNFDQGFIQGVDGIIQAVRGEYRASDAPIRRPSRQNRTSVGDVFSIFGWIALIAALIVIGYRKNYAAIIAGAFFTPPLLFLSTAFDAVLIIPGMLLGGILGLIFGMIGHSVKSSSGSSSYGGYPDDSWSSSSYSSSSSDSWSGGGGDFGGGGASSDW